VSLQSITFFWNVSDMLRSGITPASLEDLVVEIGDTRISHNDYQTTPNRDSSPWLWLQLLLCLRKVAIDNRADVRNGAIQTVFRIFNYYGMSLSGDVWSFCIQNILFGLVQADLEFHLSAEDRRVSFNNEETQAQMETSNIILQETSNLIATNFKAIIQAKAFDKVWSTLIELLEGYIGCQSHELNTTTFKALTTILASVDDKAELGELGARTVVLLWSKSFPQSKTPKVKHQSNQKPFEAYLRLWNEIYRLVKDQITAKQMAFVCASMVRCVEESDGSAYSPDADNLTELQSLVLQIVRQVRVNIEGILPVLIKVLSKFISLPFERERKNLSTQLTFVAISKAAIDLLRDLWKVALKDSEVISGGALFEAFESVVEPVARKSKWSIQGRPPTFVRKATAAATALLQETIPKIFEAEIPSESSEPFWEQVVRLADAVAQSDGELVTPSSWNPKDEAFDLDTLLKIRDLIIPDLGASAVSDSVRRKYAYSLFRNSIIHAPEASESPFSEDEPLKDIYKIRFGRTYDPTPTPRPRIAYFCLSELFSLVGYYDGSPARIRLAQAAAPFLLARVTLPVRAYIADQPLRGRLPQPTSQRNELLYVLRRMRELNSEEKAIPDLEGVTSKFKKHLHRLFPLVPKAIRVAVTDEEIFEELVLLLECVGEEFGL
jgi:hypothetical protein